MLERVLVPDRAVQVIQSQWLWLRVFLLYRAKHLAQHLGTHKLQETDSTKETWVDMRSAALSRQRQAWVNEIRLCFLSNWRHVSTAAIG